MIKDARSVSDDTVLRADVCIIGAGVAGTTLAREFIGSGMRVLLVESGGRSPSPETQELAKGDVTGQPYFDLDHSCRRGVGGTGWGWIIDLPDGTTGVRLRALDPIDFEERPEIPYSGWPLSWSEMIPYYERAHRVFGLGPYRANGEDWESLPAPPLQMDGTGARTMIFQFGRKHLFTDRYPTQIAQAPNVTVLTNATVLELCTNESADRVQAARAQTLTGTSVRIESAQFVLAAGGLQTPRLLLLSNRNQPEGLGNQHDTVGRFFMEHPHTIEQRPGAGSFRPAKSLRNKLDLYHRIQELNGKALLGYLSPTEERLRAEGLANYCCHFEPEDLYNPPYTNGYRSVRRMAYATLGRTGLPDRPFRSAWNALVGMPDAARIMSGTLVKRLCGTETVPWARTPTRLLLRHMAEQVPNPESRVLLGSKRDAFGQPRVRLHWQLQPRDVRNIQRAQEVIAEAVASSGAGTLSVASLDDIRREVVAGGHHHMGTTRMSADPNEGVVDANCRVHGVENLYVAGPSVFSTSGCANPLLTVVALALRLADHLRADVLKTMDASAGQSQLRQ